MGKLVAPFNALSEATVSTSTEVMLRGCNSYWLISISHPSLVVLYFLSGRGINGVYAVNLVLVPLILAFVFGFAPGADYAGFAYSPPSGAIYRGGMVLLYTAMNAFLAAPVACDMGAKSGGGGAGCIAAESAYVRLLSAPNIPRRERRAGRAACPAVKPTDDP